MCPSVRIGLLHVSTDFKGCVQVTAMYQMYYAQYYAEITAGDTETEQIKTPNVKTKTKHN